MHECVASARHYKCNRGVRTLDIAGGEELLAARTSSIGNGSRVSLSPGGREPQLRARQRRWYSSLTTVLVEARDPLQRIFPEVRYALDAEPA
jgi:hypothetical protein